MEYIILNNGIRMPLVGFGTAQLKGKECIESVLYALQIGYRLIDTAQMYGNEQEVGIAIKESGIPREDIFVTTKLYRKSNSYEKAKKDIDESLKNLQLDYVDLFLIHEPYSQGPEMYRALEEACKEGKIKSIGISNYDDNWFKNFILTCKIVPAINQVEAHVYYQKWDLQDLMETTNIALQAWSPLAQGIDGVARHPLLKVIGSKYNKSAAQVALRFLVQRGISVIPKSSNKDRIKENLELFDFVLSDEDMIQIRTLDRNDTLFSWTKAF